MDFRPLRLALLLQDLEFGGTQRYALNLLKLMDRNLFQPELWLLRGGEDMVPLAKEAGVDLVRLTPAPQVGPVSIACLAGTLLGRRPEMLYTLTVVPNIWGRILGRLTRVPVIVSGYRSLYPRQLERWLWPISRRIICNARAVKRVMVGRYKVSPRRIAVIPNGVDTGYIRPAPENKAEIPTVLYLGRLVEDKDPLTLGRSFISAARQNPEARFEIRGNGPYREELAALIRTSGLAGRILLKSGTGDIRPHLQRAWVLAMSSVREASPNTIIEAMAAGLPVAATRVGGIPELVADGQTGLLSEPGDPQGLAAALTRILKDRELRRQMGEQARIRACQHFTLDKMVGRTQEVLLAAAQEGGLR